MARTARGFTRTPSTYAETAGRTWRPAVALKLRNLLLVSHDDIAAHQRGARDGHRVIPPQTVEPRRTTLRNGDGFRGLIDRSGGVKRVACTRLRRGQHYKRRHRRRHKRHVIEAQALFGGISLRAGNGQPERIGAGEIDRKSTR